MNCPLKKLLMEMDYKNQANKNDGAPTTAQKDEATTAAQKAAATKDDGNKGVGDVKKASAACIDGDPCCVLLLSRYFVLMREEDIGECQDKLRKVVR